MHRHPRASLCTFSVQESHQIRVRYLALGLRPLSFRFSPPAPYSWFPASGCKSGHSGASAERGSTVFDPEAQTRRELAEVPGHPELVSRPLPRAALLLFPSP
jgi:hypothetical protein